MSTDIMHGKVFYILLSQDFSEINQDLARRQLIKGNNKCMFPSVPKQKL